MPGGPACAISNVPLRQEVIVAPRFACGGVHG